MARSHCRRIKDGFNIILPRSSPEVWIFLVLIIATTGIKESPLYLHDGRLLTLEDTVEFFNLVQVSCGFQVEG